MTDDQPSPQVSGLTIEHMTKGPYLRFCPRTPTKDNMCDSGQYLANLKMQKTTRETSLQSETWLTFVQPIWKCSAIFYPVSWMRQNRGTYRRFWGRLKRPSQNGLRSNRSRAPIVKFCPALELRPLPRPKSLLPTSPIRFRGGFQKTRGSRRK